VSAHPSMRKGPDPIDRRRWTFGAATGKAAGGRRRRRGLQVRKQAPAELGPATAVEEAGSPRRHRGQGPRTLPRLHPPLSREAIAE
jgi:hypothetical protein